MPRDDVEIVRAVLSAFNRSDPLWGGHMAEDCEFVSITAGRLESTTYRGHDGLSRYAEDRDAAWEELRFEPDEFIESGDELVVVGLLSGRGRGSGIDVDQRIAVRCRVRAGKVVRAQAYADVERALAAGPCVPGESLWPRLAGLPLVIEACEYERLHSVLAHGFERFTTHVRLVGAGADGLGEDVSLMEEDGTSLHERRPALGLEGEWTLEGFCEHVATLELFAEPPQWDMAHNWRRWAFESAALDLALRQAGCPLHEALGLEPQPVRFVNSLGLGKEEPSFEPLRRRIARSPGVRFKLDAEAAWAPVLVDEVAATGTVDTIDFKGQYGFEVEDQQALGALYDRVIAAFPDAYLEDPHDLPEITQRLRDHVDRVSYDAPIRSADDIGATPLPARVVNVKPSRIGSLRELFDVYAHCAREGRPMYGGGMGELGVGRGQIELLAALFHPDAPNDVAPWAYNQDDPAGPLPPSPLEPRPAPTGFRWEA